MIRKILEVFTKEYREYTKYIYFIQSMKDNIKLKCDSESIDDKINRLKNMNFQSNFHITIGNF